jgi:alpha-galactosidase
VSNTRQRVVTLLATSCAVAAIIIPASAYAHSGHSGRGRKATLAAFNDAATTPPMGIDDWYQNGCNVTQQDIVDNAKQLISSGLAADGYDYVILDDCWMAGHRTKKGALRPRPNAFPAGIAWLAKRIHGLGLKLGIYESAGTRTCHGYPGSYGHYAQDARTFARWGVNYVKLDLCFIPKGADRPQLFDEFGADLRADNPNIVYSQELPVGQASKPTSPNFLRLVALSSQNANLWRVTPDEKPQVSASATLDGALDADLPLYGYAGSGHWNDLDLLMTGNTVFKWTQAEQESQLSIWAEMSSPLIVSANLTSTTAVAHLASRITATTSGSLLANKAMIAIDQDPVQGHQAGRYGLMKVVVKTMQNGDYAVLVANTAPGARTITVPLSVMGIPASASWKAVWSNQHFAPASSVKWTLHGYGTVLYEVTPKASSSSASPSPTTSVGSSLSPSPSPSTSG